MQAGHEGSDVAVSVKDILNQATQWQNYCRTIKRRLPADGSAGPINLPKEVSRATAYKKKKDDLIFLNDLFKFFLISDSAAIATGIWLCDAFAENGSGLDTYGVAAVFDPDGKRYRCTSS